MTEELSFVEKLRERAGLAISLVVSGLTIAAVIYALDKPSLLVIMGAIGLAAWRIRASLRDVVLKMSMCTVLLENIAASVRLAYERENDPDIDLESVVSKVHEELMAGAREALTISWLTGF